MMQDIAMYILDLANNSLYANARNINICLIVDRQVDRLQLSISDDGQGMEDFIVEQATDPFYTTRKTRKIGLGLAFFKALADQCDGEFTLKSIKGVGTTVMIDIRNSHIDTPPIGDLSSTLITLIQADDLVDYRFTYRYDHQEFEFDTRKIKSMLDDVKINELNILLWIKEFLSERINELQEGKR